jgi:translocation protein SEC63
MIEIAHQRRWLQTTLATIRFQQCVVQALWGNDSPLLQLPHFTDEMARAVVRGAKGGAGRALWEFIRAAPTDRKGLSELSPAHVEDVTRACDLFPHLEASYDLYVEEEEGDFFDDEDVTPAAGAEAVQGAVRGEEIYENDLVTLRVKLLRQNVAEGEHAPPVHAPLFPATIREGWWLILTDKPRVDSSVSAGEAEATIHAIERIADQSRSVKHEVRFMAPPQAGTYRMLLHVLSDCYAGLDEEIEIEFTVKPAGELPVYKPHQEDLELDNEPTLFEQVMTADVDDSSDEEDEEDEGERPVGGAELKRSAVKQMASPVSLDEDSEEED